MKKLILGVLALLLLTFAACAGASDGEGPSSGAATTPTVGGEVTENNDSASGEFYLTVQSPENESVVNTTVVPVSGATALDAVVTVNGLPVEVDEDGGFSTEVELEEGPNAIEVIASDFHGNETSAVISVIYVP